MSTPSCRSKLSRARRIRHASTRPSTPATSSSPPTDIFARAAEEVLARHGESSGYVEYIAAYLHEGLNRTGRAIEILLIAHRQKVLEESGQRQLIIYLQDTGRYGESIALLEPLVKTRPEDLYYRIWLMSA